MVFIIYLYINYNTFIIYNILSYTVNLSIKIVFIVFKHLNIFFSKTAPRLLGDALHFQKKLRKFEIVILFNYYKTLRYSEHVSPCYTRNNTKNNNITCYFCESHNMLRSVDTLKNLNIAKGHFNWNRFIFNELFNNIIKAYTRIITEENLGVHIPRITYYDYNVSNKGSSTIPQ